MSKRAATGTHTNKPAKCECEPNKWVDRRSIKRGDRWKCKHGKKYYAFWVEMWYGKRNKSESFTVYDHVDWRVDNRD